MIEWIKVLYLHWGYVGKYSYFYKIYGSVKN